MKKNKPAKERRQSMRFRIHSLIKHATEPNVITFQLTNIWNLSRNGLAFFTEQKIKEGAVLRLYFLLPNREKMVEARGKVVRCPQVMKHKKPFEVGLQFSDVSRDGKLAIQEIEAFFLERQKKARP